MINNEDIITIGYNSSIKKWNQKNLLIYSSSIDSTRKEKIKESSFPSKQVPFSGLIMSKKLFKRYNINTLLVKDINYESRIF